MAVHTLGRIGPGAKDAIPALIALFERSDPSRELRLAVTIAQGEELVTLARQMLDSGFPSERRRAIDTLLKVNGIDELSPLIVRWGSVQPQTRAAIAAGLFRAGYQFVEKDRQLGIERLPSIN